MAVDSAQLPAPLLRVIALMPIRQKLGLMVSLAAVIALLAGAWMWGTAPDYRVLYANLSDRDGGSIIAALQQMNVPYKFAEGGGALLVPAGQVHEMRLRLASQGLPKGGQVGFELMESQKLGTSQFQEQVNYQRALEGELARSIQTLSSVQNARVHLAFAKPSVFVREQQKPSASVLLNLHPGRSLDPSQVNAIVHLVSSSISDLPVGNVTVVDQNGKLLSAQGGNNVGLDPGQLKYVHEVERDFAKRIEAIIAPITGPTNVRAEVTADIDFSQIENIAEIYSPNQSAQAAVRSQQTSESSGTPGASAVGVPGALSNQPPANATAPITAAPAANRGQTPASATPGQAPAVAKPAPQSQAAPQTPTSAAATSTRRDSTVNYEVDKTIRHTRQPVGAIKRLSVAVVVNHRKAVDEAGNVTTKPLAPQEIEQINNLVKEVMGYNKDRGDTLNVTNSAFSAAEEDVPQEVPLWKQPETIATLKDAGRYALIAGVVLFLVLGVLRPLLIRLSEQPVPLPAAEPGETTAFRAQRHAGLDESLNAAKQLARHEPKLVANVVKEWVSGDE